MDEKWIEKLIGFAVIAIVANYILSFVAPYLFYAVIGLVWLRLAQEYYKNKK